MKTRETIDVITPVSNQKVVLMKWLTGGERRDLRNSFLSKADLNIGGKQEISKINSKEAIEEAENKAIEIMVISIDGNTEKIVDQVLGMRDTDYYFVIKEIEKITDNKSFLEQEPKPEDGIG